MKFVIKPNLPDDVGLIIIGEKYSTILKKPLERMGIEVLLSPDNPSVDARISGHADVSVLHLGGNKLALAPYLKGSAFEKSLVQIGTEIIFPDIVQGDKYPFDSGLNMCICGDKLIHNPKSAQIDIAKLLTKSVGYKPIEVKQGYTKCSVCVLQDNLIITSDQLIHEKAQREGIESLKISPGYIELPGFEYGFIGGAAFKINKDTVAFTGILDGHPSKDLILNYLSLHNLTAVYITSKPLFDVGGAIQIVEK